MEYKSFKYWTRQAIADEFGLDKNPNCQYLNNWLEAKMELDQGEKERLDRLRLKLRNYVDLWNEQELVIKFIALLIDLVDYDNPNYKAFANRRLTGKIDDKEISGEVDLMLASGKYEPKAPYFCLHEFKKEQGTERDPYGQLLIAMMIAAELNGGQNPIYGAFVTGRNWFFLTLKDRKYCISDEYVATRTDLYSIYSILKKLKYLVGDMPKLGSK